MTDIFDYSKLIVSDISINGTFINGTMYNLLTRVVPLGTIIAWHDVTTIPNGWSLCDGTGIYTDRTGQQKNIPDLRSKFIIGYDSRDASFNIDTSNSTILHKVSDSDPNLPRSAFTLGDVNDNSSTSNEKDNVYFHLAYIICSGHPFTSSVCDRKVEGKLIGGGAILSNRLTAIDISVNSNVIDNSANININTDTSYNLGRSSIGYNGYGISSVSFSHIDHDSSNNYCLKHDNTANTFINSISDKSISFNIANANKGTIDNSGNLGINSTTPFSQLEIGGASSVGSSSEWNNLSSEPSNAPSDSLVVAGSIGIGIGRVPYSKLEVSGSILGNGIIPIGGIIMWSGAVQSGYPLENGVIHYNFVRCQGQTINGIAVPDLRNKYIMGVDSNIGSTGGQNTVTLQDANLPSHTHNYTINRGDDHNFNSNFGGPYFLGSDENVNQAGGGGSGQLTSGGNLNRSTSGTSPDALQTAYDNRPQYYTLLYLIRIA